MKVITHCSLCQSTDLKCLWDLPQLPLSETYGTFDASFKHYDQALLYCNSCGHVQLKYQLPAGLLYSKDSYHYSTSKSSSTTARVASFMRFVKKYVDSIQTVVDIGGNDGSLLRIVEAENKYLIDPSINNIDASLGIELLQGFVEDIDIKSLKPDAIFCCHTLEHIGDPARFLSLLLKSVDLDAVLFFEVPCFVEQTKAIRMDAIFHQHYHYFHPATLIQLIEQSGGQVLGIDYNDYPTCGGSVIVAFKAKRESGELVCFTNPYISKEEIDDLFSSCLAKFELLNDKIRQWLEIHPVVYGYGASLLLPVIFYHIGEHSDKIKRICDDDPDKLGWGYKNLQDLTVCSSEILDNNPEAKIIITTYENIVRLSDIIESRFPGRQFSGFINSREEMPVSTTKLELSTK